MLKKYFHYFKVTRADGGALWTLQTASPNTVWRSIASSQDGTRLVATEWIPGGGNIYTSNDSGVTRIMRTGAGLRFWSSIVITK